MENAGGDHGSTERLAAVEEEIAELEERLQKLRAKQQELSELQELSITVGNLAWNVTSDMVRQTFEQVAVVWQQLCSMTRTQGTRLVGMWWSLREARV